MTHDPMCPARECCDDVSCDYCGGCRCELIEQVRADERSEFANALRDGVFGLEADVVNREAEAFLTRYATS